MPVVAGVGYSMSVDVPHQTQGMLYFPEARLATTNYKNRLRISTFMQMTDVETPENPRRRQRLLDLAKQVIPKANWDSVTDFWSGGRPLSGDGKPLIGQTRTKGVYVNSGHGMWGITLAPVSAKELTNLIVDGKPLSPAFNPLR
jgi:D-amino-acid dehydrogenase